MMGGKVADRNTMIKNGELEEEEERGALEWLMDAFPTLSLEQIACAYSNANCDAHRSADILASLLEQEVHVDTNSTSNIISSSAPPSSSPFIEEREESNAFLRLLPNKKDDFLKEKKDASKSSYNKKTRRPKKISVCTGTVSSVLGNGYSRAMLSQTKSLKRKDTKQKQKEIQVDEVGSGLNRSMHSLQDQDEIHVEEFLYSMMGDDWQLEMDVVRNVLSQCGYDIEKSLNRLLEMVATTSKVHYEDLPVGDTSGTCSSEKDGLIEISFRAMSESFPDRDQDDLLKACQAAEGDIEVALSILLDNEHMNAMGTKAECIRGQLDTDQKTVKSNLENLKSSFPDLSESVLNELLKSVNFNYSEAKNILLEAGMESRHGGSVDRSGLSRQVLESLFSIEETSEKAPPSMDFVKAVKLKKKSKKITLDTSSGNQPESIESLPTNGEEDEYVLLRKTASQNWSTMRTYFQEAASAYSRGERTRAGYLSAEGNHYKQLAREADEKASQRIFDFKNKDMNNDVTIDLHSQHVKDAIRLLKLHIQSLASISSIHSLKVITGNGAHGTGRGRIKRAITHVLEKEGINWTEENSGMIVIKIKDVDPDNLSFVTTDIDA